MSDIISLRILSKSCEYVKKSPNLTSRGKIALPSSLWTIWFNKSITVVYLFVNPYLSYPSDPSDPSGSFWGKFIMSKPLWGK